MEQQEQMAEKIFLLNASSQNQLRRLFSKASFVDIRDRSQALTEAPGQAPGVRKTSWASGNIESGIPCITKTCFFFKEKDI